APAAAAETLDEREQLERAERLAHELVGAAAAGAAEVVAFGAGQEHDRDPGRRRVCLQAAAEGGAVHPRHAQVEDDDVRVLTADRRLRLLARAGLLDRDSGL